MSLWHHQMTHHIIVKIIVDLYDNNDDTMKKMALLDDSSDLNDGRGDCSDYQGL